MEGEIDPLWHLHDHLTVEQAAALIAGYDPASVENCWGDSNFAQNHPKLYIVREALVNAIKKGKLKADVVATGHYVHVRYVGNESEGYWEPVDEISTSGTLIELEELKRWLTSRGIRSGFFFPDSPGEVPGYLDQKHPRYAPKLAAAIRAWEAVEEPRGRRPRQALEKWLREHAAEFGLTNEDGNPIEKAIEEMSKVANWEPKGGAPKTPG